MYLTPNINEVYKLSKKLLFFDIDGTLLAGSFHDGYVPESAIKALQMAQANGHLCFINTGRTRSFVPKAIKEYPFDGYVYGCGTEVSLHGETIYHKILPDELKRGLETKTRQANVQIVAEGPEFIYHENRPDLFPEVSRFLLFYNTLGLGRQVLQPLDSSDLDFSKFIILFDETGDIPLIQELLSPDFQYIPREQMGRLSFAEIVPHGCSKATGIDLLAAHLGCSLDDCYVFGDSNNDLSMLRHVKHSIAMEKSSEEVLKTASYVTTDIEADGIYNAMKHLGLI